MYLIITRWNQPKGMLSRLICHSTVTYPHHASHSYLSCHQHFLALTAPTIRLSPNCCTILCDKIVFCDKICFMWQNYVFLWQKMFYVTKYVVCDQMCVTWQNMFYVTQCFMWQKCLFSHFYFLQYHHLYFELFHNLHATWVICLIISEYWVISKHQLEQYLWSSKSTKSIKVYILNQVLMMSEHSICLKIFRV